MRPRSPGPSRIALSPNVLTPSSARRRTKRSVVSVASRATLTPSCIGLLRVARLFVGSVAALVLGAVVRGLVARRLVCPLVVLAQRLAHGVDVGAACLLHRCPTSLSGGSPTRGAEAARSGRGADQPPLWTCE